MQVRAYGYCRLSRHDPDADAPLEQRFALRRRTVEETAALHGLTLIDTYCEQESGDRIADRPLFRQLLDLCARNMCTHVVTQEQSRILRGDKRDEAEVEDTFVDAGVVLITQTEVTDFGSPHYDPLPYEVRTLLARDELRKYRRRRMEANRQKAATGKRYCGWAPYGYRRDPAGVGGYAIIPAEYAILEELFRRARTESLYALARDLNERQIPPPGHGRRKDAGERWHYSVLRRMMLNPFYAGYPARRQTVVRHQQRRLPEEEWTWAEEEQLYPHPLNLAEWEHLRSLVSSRNEFGGDRAASPHPLTGLMRCPAGQPMRARGSECYGCDCRQRGDPHQVRYVQRTIAEAAACEILRRHLHATLAQAQDGVHAPEDLRQRYDTARKAHRTATRQMDEIRRNAALLRRVSEENYATALAMAERELADAAAVMESIRGEMETQAVALAPDLADAIREFGIDAIWDRASSNERRDIVRFVVARIDVLPPADGAKTARHLRFELRRGGEDTLSLREIWPHYTQRKK